MEPTVAILLQELQNAADPRKAEGLARYFQVRPGGYGEGDIFLGLTVPQQVKISKKYVHLGLTEIQQLLNRPEHECRFTALTILVEKYRKDPTAREGVYQLYLDNTDRINNWDLVDTSAEFIVGPWLQDRPEKMQVLSQLARSESIWERRIAMLSPFHEIKQNQFLTALAVAELLVYDEQDLIRKAVGWMLREIGKRSRASEVGFLDRYAATMPRTALRYALEHFEPAERSYYMKLKDRTE